MTNIKTHLVVGLFLTSVVARSWESKSEEFSRLLSDVVIRDVSYPNDLFCHAEDLKVSAKNLGIRYPAITDRQKLAVRSKIKKV